MGYNDLNDAREEIRRLKLIIGMKSDDNLSTDGDLDEGRIKSEMAIRMKVWDELEKEKEAEKDIEKANDEYERMLTNYIEYENFQIKIRKNMDVAESRMEFLQSERESAQKDLAEAKQIFQEMRMKIVKLEQSIGPLDQSIREHENNVYNIARSKHAKSQRAMEIHLSRVESSRDKVNDSIKRYNELCAPESRKKLRVDTSSAGMGEMSTKFEMGVKISDQLIKKK